MQTHLEVCDANTPRGGFANISGVSHILTFNFWLLFLPHISCTVIETNHQLAQWVMPTYVMLSCHQICYACLTTVRFLWCMFRRRLGGGYTGKHVVRLYTDYLGCGYVQNRLYIDWSVVVYIL